MVRQPEVHLLCGMVGAGKTTLARQIAERHNGVRFTLDEWMRRLHGGLRYDDPAYVAALAACQGLIWDTAQQVLASGHDVVLDWNQWSCARRAEWASVARAVGALPIVHFLDVSVDLAVERAVGRADSDPFSHELDEAAVRHLGALFEAPTQAEGIEIVMHR